MHLTHRPTSGCASSLWNTASTILLTVRHAYACACARLLVALCAPLAHALTLRTAFLFLALSPPGTGDDITLNELGEDTYAAPKAAGKFLTLKRTEGVSSTNIVGRLLNIGGKSHHIAESAASPAALDTEFLATTRRFAQFSKGVVPAKTDRVVLLTGAFDLFHVGHIEAIGAAKKEGDYLIVGVHSDKTVNRLRGEVGVKWSQRVFIPYP